MSQGVFSQKSGGKEKKNKKEAKGKKRNKNKTTPKRGAHSGEVRSSAFESGQEARKSVSTSTGGRVVCISQLSRPWSGSEKPFFLLRRPPVLYEQNQHTKKTNKHMPRTVKVGRLQCFTSSCFPSPEGKTKKTKTSIIIIIYFQRDRVPFNSTGEIQQTYFQGDIEFLETDRNPLDSPAN